MLKKDICNTEFEVGQAFLELCLNSGLRLFELTLVCMINSKAGKPEPAGAAQTSETQT